jgi:hypothetical protein
MRAEHWLNGVFTPVTPVFCCTVTEMAVEPAMLPAPLSAPGPESVCADESVPPPASAAGASPPLELPPQPVAAASARTPKKKVRDAFRFVPSFMVDSLSYWYWR